MTIGRAPLRSFAVAAFVVASIALSAPYFPERFSDVRAFYCGGQTVVARADPYREHPLAECEQRVRAPGLSPLRGGVAVPVPFPGYVLGLFALFSLLPFPIALALWMVASVAAVTLAVVLLAELTQTPRAATAILVGFPAATVALPLAQVTPFVLLAIVAAGYLLGAQRPRLAALAVLGTLLDPHVGVAAVLGLLAGSPRSRLTLLLGIAGLAALGLVVSGLQREAEYLAAVLPAHALANVADSMQFSTTNFAYLAGLPVSIALAFGSIWYALSLATGTLVALRLRSRLGAAAPAFLPPAFAVFGGTHTHLAQLAMAIPAFVLLCANARGTSRSVCAVVTFLAATPWLLIGPFPFVFPATAILAMCYARSMNIERCALALAATSLLALCAIFVTIVRTHVVRADFDARVTGNPLAEVSWQLFVLARNSPPEYWSLVAKVPTVLAFVLLFGVLVTTALSRRALVREC